MEKKKQENQNIQVFVRVRPLNKFEKKSTNMLEVTKNNILVRDKVYKFDNVFGVNSEQIDVYKKVVSPLIAEVLSGYNCTVFAYGQTGTGKTFTMEGMRPVDENQGWEMEPLSGIVPRAMSQLFDELRRQSLEFTMRVSYLEMYNELLTDLLSTNDDMQGLKIFDDTKNKGSIMIPDQVEMVVNSKKDVYDILKRGSGRRQTAPTLMNANSSRSHTIFSVTVHIKETILEGEDLLKIGKINLVDLAGSENIGRSGATDLRAHEAGNINKSLLTLSRTITALVEHQPHIPYRESKLTRLLQDSLGGKTKTSIIATVSPAASNIEETLSTLDYALRAKNIQNRPQINQHLTQKAVLKEYTEEIERLRRDLEATCTGEGVLVDRNNYNRMNEERTLWKEEIAERLKQIKALEDKKDTLMEDFSELKTKLRSTANHLDLTRSDLQETREILTLTEEERDVRGAILDKQIATEIELTEQAKKQQIVAVETYKDLENLYNKTERLLKMDSTNVNSVKKFHGELGKQLSMLDEAIVNFGQAQSSVSLKEQTEKLLKMYKNLEEETLNNIKLSVVGLNETNQKLNDLFKKIILSGSGNFQIHQRKIMTVMQKCVKTMQNAFSISILNDIVEESNKITTELRENLCEEVGNEGETISEFCSLIAANCTIAQDKLFVLNHDNSEKIREQQAELNRVMSLLKQEKEKNRMLVEKVESLTQKQQVQQNSALETFVKSINESFKNQTDEILQLKSEFEGVDTIMNVEKAVLNVQDSLKFMEHSSDAKIHKIKNTVKEIENCSTSCNADSTANCIEIISLVEDGNDQIGACSARTSQMLKDVQASLKETCSKHDISWTSHQTQLKRNDKILVKELNGDITMQKKHLKNMEFQLKDLEEEQMAIATNCSNEFTVGLNSLNKSLYDKDLELQETATVREKVLDFTKYSLKSDMPTGCTPGRIVRTFPQKLKTTSPHDSIRTDFLAQKQKLSLSKAASMNDLLLDEPKDKLSSFGSLATLPTSDSHQSNSSEESSKLDLSLCFIKGASNEENKDSSKTKNTLNAKRKIMDSTNLALNKKKH